MLPILTERIFSHKIYNDIRSTRLSKHEAFFYFAPKVRTNLTLG